MNNSAGRTTDIMAEELELLGHKVVRLRYTPVYLKDTRSLSRQNDIAIDLIRQIRTAADQGEPIDIFAHSYGAILVDRILHRLPSGTVRNVLLLSPAMDSDWLFPEEGFKRMDVYFNPHDIAIQLAHRIPLGHPFGDMGTVGYDGVKDSKIHNHRFTDWGLFKVNHNLYFKPEAAARISDFWGRVVSDSPLVLTDSEHE